jgi:acetate kinase
VTGGLTVLTLNCGSSSLKFALLRRRGATFERLVEGEAEEIGGAEGRLTLALYGRPQTRQDVAFPDHEAATQAVFAALAAGDSPPPQAIGHRIVHGGPSVRRHGLIDAGMLRALEAAAPLAPLHVPPALAVVKAARAHFKDLSQVACLDTAFHRTLPDAARRFPLGPQFAAKGIERYGFHGLSCESILHQLGDETPERLVIAHLGGGSSVTAVRAGRSIDTSMGLTPAGGVMMATRSGDLDPGLMIYLIREAGMDASALETLLDRHAGMKAVSALSGDLRQLRAAPENPQAQLAIQMFSYAVRKQIAAMSVALEGLDMLVFTGGIGQNDAGIRADVCAGLAWTGFSQSRVRVFAADEEQQIARITETCLAGPETRQPG